MIGIRERRRKTKRQNMEMSVIAAHGQRENTTRLCTSKPFDENFLCVDSVIYIFYNNNNSIIT